MSALPEGILLGDCILKMRTLPDNCIDSIVTDPPYELGFMGKAWDASGIANNVEMWREALRVLKPGGHLLAFSGSRTYHRMACAIEDAGFEIRDQIMWVYGSGFPKSLNVGKAIESGGGRPEDIRRMQMGANYEPSGRGRVNYDHGAGSAMDAGSADWSSKSDAARQWHGWGTALKPAHEPIVVARKPLVGTVAANVLTYGTGALNIDGCRVPTEDDLNGGAYSAARKPSTSEWVAHGGTIHDSTGKEFVAPSGRWPANLIHDGSDEVLAAFPSAPGQQGPISSTAPSAKTSNVYGAMKREGEPSQDSENNGSVGFKMKPGARRFDEGSAARFFYCAKASKSDRGVGNDHSTVKPTDLMRYLCRLVTPPGGVVLDPFTGSGSTGKAAALEGFRFIGIEQDMDYALVAHARIEAARAEVLS